MQGNILIQGVETEFFMREMANRLAKQVLTVSDAIPKELLVARIPYLTPIQAKLWLGVGETRFVSLLQEHPDKVQPQFPNNRKTPFYKTEEIINLENYLKSTNQ